ncbi:MAG: carboxypeptidase-like regulatory domain-containing protein, partial [Candidatus Cybelea sp.]
GKINPVICLVLTLAAISPAPEITGTIVDYNGRLVSEVAISVVALYANQTIEKSLSGSDGSFHFAGLAPGAYGLAAKTDSGCAISDPIRVDIGFTTVVHLRLIKGLCQSPIAILPKPTVKALLQRGSSPHQR